jgi:hypothetical protein
MATPFVVAAAAAVSVLACAGILFTSVLAPTPPTPLRGRRRRTAKPGHDEQSGGVLQRAREHTVSVVVPTLNEAKNVQWVLERLPGFVTEVVLVDGLSTDDTEVVARGAVQDVVVVHQPQPGKGAALRAGFAAATGDIIVMIDADGSTNPDEMGVFVRALEEGADFVKGSRYLHGGGSNDWTHIRRAGNRGFVHMVNLVYGSRFTDLCYGYCAFWRRNLDALALTATGFEIETQLTLNAVKAGLEIREVASFELPRRDGASNLNAVRDGLRVLRTILDERPGRDHRRAAEKAEICLVPVELAEPGSHGWRPAGNDRRRNDRRVRDRIESGYTGPERRKANRRTEPHSTVTVYRVAVEPEKVKLPLAA